MTDIETLTTRELVDELRRRSNASVILLHMPEDKTGDEHETKMFHGGDHFTRVGMLEAVKRDLLTPPLPGSDRDQDE